MKSDEVNDRMFIGHSATGIVYSDRTREAQGDYVRLATLRYDTLELAIEKGCPPELIGQIEADAETTRGRRGTRYMHTTTQDITLGYALPYGPMRPLATRERPKKRFALIPSEREKECDHVFVHEGCSRARVPVRTCRTCGASEPPPTDPALWTTRPAFGVAGGPLEVVLTAEGAARAFTVGSQVRRGAPAEAIGALYSEGGRAYLTKRHGSRIVRVGAWKFDETAWGYLRERYLVKSFQDETGDGVQITVSGRETVERGLREQERLLERCRAVASFPELCSLDATAHRCVCNHEQGAHGDHGCTVDDYEDGESPCRCKATAASYLS